MPIDYSEYSDDWPEISRAIRDRSGGRCECVGECENEHDQENLKAWLNGIGFADMRETKRCAAENYKPNPFTGSRVVLTVAHLDHDKMNNDPANLQAFCQRCHLTYDRAYDRDRHIQNRLRNARRRQIDAGQRKLFE